MFTVALDFGVEVAGNRLPLAIISMEGPPGFRFGFSLPFFVVVVGYAFV